MIADRRPKVFRGVGMALQPAVTDSGTTSIARVVHAGFSRHMGAGVEYLENVTIDWTVTYDEILFIKEGRLTLRFDDGEHECEAGDIVWLPEGTHLQYVARERAGYFYALYPVDWAARQGTVEP
ncbi:MAG: AraC family ligand binding domain-containing protein [Rhizobiaceae bacterium]|nr:AraC family ligand binding domain-containing protein [Rhizobiaceae bacterium]